MAANPLVSVIIPCYNVAAYADEAILSIRNQSYRNLEIILIDDCSTDNTLGIIKKHATEDNRVKVVQNDVNLKLIRTLNKGISLASGEYIARMDSDDISATERIEKQLEFLQQHPETDLVSCFANYIRPDGRFHSWAIHFCCTTFQSMRFMAMLESPFLHAALVGKTSVFKKYQFRDSPETVHIEDYELWTRMLADGIILSAIPQRFYYYRRNPGSVSHKGRNQQYANHIKCSEHFIDVLLDEKLKDDVFQVLLTRAEDHKVSLLREVFPAFNKLRNSYFQKFARTFTSTDRFEIEEWIRQRKLRIAVFYLLKANLIRKVEAAIFMIGFIPQVFRPRTFARTTRNIISKVQWVLHR